MGDWGIMRSVGRFGMAKTVEKIADDVRELTDVEKLRLVDTILCDLDKPDPGPGPEGQVLH
jgi:hypothetical protein